jgi:hypothetical protein
MVYKRPLKRRGDSQSDSGELLVFLLDHALLRVKQRSKADQFKVYRRVRSGPALWLPKTLTTRLLQPIPLELLHIIATDETGMRPIVSRPLRNSSNPNGDRNA